MWSVHVSMNCARIRKFLVFCTREMFSLRTLAHLFEPECNSRVVKSNLGLRFQRYNVISILKLEWPIFTEQLRVRNPVMLRFGLPFCPLLYFSLWMYGMKSISWLGLRYNPWEYFQVREVYNATSPGVILLALFVNNEFARNAQFNMSAGLIMRKNRWMMDCWLFVPN